jgi:hypothetical protein
MNSRAWQPLGRNSVDGEEAVQRNANRRSEKADREDLIGMNLHLDNRLSGRYSLRFNWARETSLRAD